MGDFDLAVFSLNPLNREMNNGAVIADRIKVVTNNEFTTGIKPKFSYLSSMKPLRKLYKEFQPDIVHAHYASSYGLLGRLLGARPFFISVWGSDVYEFPKRSLIHRFVFKRVVNSANHLFSTSHDMARELAKYTKNEITVIPFGIDIHLFCPEPRKKEEGRKIIGTVKSLEHVYGIDRLIRTTSLLVKEYPGLECHIYGEGSQKEQLIGLAKELGIEDAILFKGYINNKELPSVLRSFDVFCVLSRQESFGVAAVEAQACGIPVIATKVGGLPEIVMDGKTGYTVGEDPEEAARKISFLLSDREQLDKMSNEAREEVLRKYDWSSNVRTLKDHYLSCKNN